MALTPPWVLVLMIALIVVGALGGAYLGKAALKKHFKRAGIT
jgi:energy-coupling factor transport system substrate-specific component